MEDPIFLIHINKLNMICPYCHQDHPDNTQYCPQTGRKIQDKKLACTENPHCSIHGQFILPAGSRFCPECGSPIKQRDTPRERQTKNNNSSTTINFEDSLDEINNIFKITD